jgi:phosphatidylglycerol---prolipoprotein diacylglyceryl transferase
MFPTIQVGPLNIQAPGLILIISLWLGLNLAEKFAKLRSYPTDKLYNLVFISLIAGVLGARLFFILGNLNSFIGNLNNILSLNPGLLDPFGGMVTALLAAIIYVHRTKLPFWETLDALTPIIAVLMIGVGISHLSSGNAYGTETSMPWGVRLWGAIRHPSQIYEIIASSLTLAIIWRDFSKTNNSGLIFLEFSMITSIWLILIEGFRGDSHTLIGGIRSGQLADFVFLGIVLILYEKRLSNNLPLGKGDAQNG